jgi:hypothetical protein
MVWLLSIVDSIITTVFSFFLWIVMLWTLTMSSILGNEKGQELYCDSVDAGVELCEKKEWSIVT